MKRNDLIFILLGCLIFIPFLISTTALEAYKLINQQHGMWMSFVKFALLATSGEALALRLRTGNYNQKGFGLIPKAIVWGFLGFTIKMAFVIFAKGTPYLVSYLANLPTVEALVQQGWIGKVLIAFSISTMMNLIFAPVMMTLHKLTDIHITLHQGKISSLWTRFDMPVLFGNINWQIHWHFVFKKTIPFFWIPAHTITFLLPEDFQVLFAALLGVALGLILAIASLKTAK